jgi:hypothetical protein
LLVTGTAGMALAMALLGLDLWYQDAHPAHGAKRAVRREPLGESR